MTCLAVFNKKTKKYIIFGGGKLFRRGQEADMFALQNFSVPSKKVETKDQAFVLWTIRKK